jgi:glycine betaine/proline transport system permease protein
MSMTMMSPPRGGLGLGETIARRAPAFAILALLLAFALGPALAGLMPAWLVDYPKTAVVPIAGVVGDWLTWLAREAAIGPVRVADITRGLAAIVEAPMDLMTVVFVTGVRTGSGADVVTAVQPVSWIVVIALAAMASHMIGGARLAMLTAGGLFYIVVFGFHTEAMQTVISVVMSTAVSVALGVAIGAAAVKRPWLAAPIEGAMNVMQTVPVFAYLVPTLLFLGYGPSAAMVATVIYALPPMVHATMLGLKGVPDEIVEFGRMAGASRRAMFWKIKLPVALPSLAVGINQSIMAALNIVVIASMIGAGGLGYVVLIALRKLDIGGALEAGLAIVVVAVILDRVSLAAAKRAAAGATFRAHALPYGRLALAALVGGTVLALAMPALQAWPTEWRLTTAPYWNALVSWINVNLFTPLDAIRTFTLLNIMNPTRLFLLAVPWVIYLAFVGVAGYVLGGIRLAASAMGLVAFIAVTGFWDPAIVSVYLCGLGVILSLAIGLPIGYVASRSEKAREATGVVLDTLQTLPTLVYLLPAVMLFKNGDFSALLAVVSYAVAPAVRYAMHAFAAVPTDRLEAAAMFGASRFQTLKWVRLPSAFPMLLLGVNQTVMMALAMLVITALVGTRDLGQQVFTALSRAKVGDGIVAGLCVACLALTVDALIKAWAKRVAERDGVKL